MIFFYNEIQTGRRNGKISGFLGEETGYRPVSILAYSGTGIA